MTRGRWVAVAVTLVAIVVVVPVGPYVWRELAYRDEHVWSGHPELITSVKRWAWLPGEPFYYPLQVCPQCQIGRHWCCWSEDDTGLSLPFHCTCPRRPHPLESE